MSFTLCTSDAAIVKAGVNANAALILNVTRLNQFSDEVEASINAITNKDWVADIATVKPNFVGILQDLASDEIAMKIIAHDLQAYGTLEATTMLDLLTNNANRNRENLRLTKVQEVTTN